MFKKLIVIIFLISLPIGSLYFFLFTDRGAELIVRPLMSHYIKADEITFGRVDGNLAGKISVDKIEVKGLDGLPDSTLLKIQKIEAASFLQDMENYEVDIYNGKLNFPVSDPVFFFGRYVKGRFDLEAYSGKLNIREMLDLFYKEKDLKKVSGFVKDLDCKIKGVPGDLEAEGDFFVDQFSFEKIKMVGSPCSFSLKLKGQGDDLKLHGEVSINGGEIKGPRSSAKVRRSKILFRGKTSEAGIEFAGVSLIEGIKIDIEVTGTFEKPVIKLTSQPRLPEERLMLILATGKAWKGVETAVEERKITPEIARDFVEYFVFGGPGNKLAERFGLKEITVTYDAQTKGVGLRKAVTDKANVGYTVSQPQARESPQATKHKVNGEVRITENVSLEGERETEQSDKTMNDKAQSKDKVLLKFKSAF